MASGWARTTFNFAVLGTGNGREELPIPVKVEFDVYYLLNRSLALDLRIIALTFLKVVKNEGVTH